MKIGDQVEVTTGSWTGSVGTVVDKQTPPAWVSYHPLEPRYLVRLPRGMERQFRASELKVVTTSHATIRRGKKSPAQLQREIDEALKEGQYAELMARRPVPPSRGSAAEDDEEGAYAELMAHRPVPPTRGSATRYRVGGKKAWTFDTLEAAQKHAERIWQKSGVIAAIEEVHPRATKAAKTSARKPSHATKKTKGSMTRSSTGADPDHSAYIGDESYGVYTDVKKRSDGWFVVATVDGEHFTDSLPDDGPYPTRQAAATAAVGQATEIAEANAVRVTAKDRKEAVKFLMTP